MDLFYYGSQDIPLPFQGGEGGRARPRPGFCESCSAPVPVGDLETGRASETYGLVLCANCREMARAEERIELYFCDRCHVSVPVYRVDTGEALVGDGRILCLSCRARLTRLHGPRLALIGVLLLVGVVLGVLVVRRLQPGPPPPATPDPAVVLGGILASLDRELARIPGAAEAEGISRRIRGLMSELDAVQDERIAVLKKVEECRAGLLSARASFDVKMDLLESETAMLGREIERLMSEAPVTR